jgi:hypothetical protein
MNEAEIVTMLKERIRFQEEGSTNAVELSRQAALAAVSALRSYQYGNSSAELAEEIADSLESALKPFSDLVSILPGERQS